MLCDATFAFPVKNLHILSYSRESGFPDDTDYVNIDGDWCVQACVNNISRRYQAASLLHAWGISVLLGNARTRAEEKFVHNHDQRLLQVTSAQIEICLRAVRPSQVSSPNLLDKKKYDHDVKDWIRMNLLRNSGNVSFGGKCVYHVSLETLCSQKFV